MKEYFSLHYLLPSSPTAILTKNVSYFYMKIAGVIFQIDFNSLSQLAKKKEKRAFLVLFFSSNTPVYSYCWIFALVVCSLSKISNPPIPPI